MQELATEQQLASISGSAEIADTDPTPPPLPPPLQMKCLERKKALDATNK